MTGRTPLSPTLSVKPDEAVPIATAPRGRARRGGAPRAPRLRGRPERFQSLDRRRHRARRAPRGAERDSAAAGRGRRLVAGRLSRQGGGAQLLGLLVRPLQERDPVARALAPPHRRARRHGARHRRAGRGVGRGALRQALRAHLPEPARRPRRQAEGVRRHGRAGDARDRPPRAERERSLITSLIAQCKSKADIKAALVRQYGHRVLALPPRKGFDITAYLVPALALLAALSVIGAAALRWRRRSDGPRPAPGTTTSASGDSERLDADLERYE